MNLTTSNTKFSTIIPTRGNDKVVLKAIQSVNKQSYTEIEIIVVVDSGANSCFINQWLTEVELTNSITVVKLCKYSNGHGPSFSRNVGANHATGDYICFLDDDDFWIDINYLDKVNKAILNSEYEIDIFFSNQNAIKRNTIIDDLWLNKLKDLRSFKSVHKDFLNVSVLDLVQIPSFCHINTTIIAKKLFWDVGGFDESIRYEEDLDFYFRIIENAHTIYYYPYVTSHHIVPTKKENASKSINAIGKYFYTIKVLEKNFIASKNLVISKAIQEKIYYLNKNISIMFFKKKLYEKALYFINKTLFFKYDIKVRIYIIYLRSIIIIQKIKG